jgi:uncharacterized protein YegP (UPF0339 family)
MKIVLYKDKKGEYRWRLVARNGRIIADSAESYKQKSKMMHIVQKLLDTCSFLFEDKTGK